MIISYKKGLEIFDNIYINRSKLSGDIVKKLNKMKLPNDGNFIRNVNDLREELESAENLHIFNNLRTGDNKAKILAGAKKDDLTFYLRINKKHRKEFLWNNGDNEHCLNRDWKDDFQRVKNIIISKIHPHEFKK